MHAAPGLGLAAPQIGVSLQVTVIELPKGEEENQDPYRGKLIVLCNPEIVKSWGEEEGQEGCLSLPEYVGDVKRGARVIVKAQNRRGKKIRIRTEGFMARVLQHEIDHLDGILNTFRYGFTNATLEGTNNKIKLVIHKAFGFRSLQALLAMIYLCCGGIDLQ